MRYVYLLLFAVILAAPFVMRRAVVAGRGPGPDAGDGERLVIVTPHGQDIRREFARAFDAWHRATHGAAAAIDFRTPGGTQDVKRLLDTTYRPYRDPAGKLPDDVPASIDVVWGGGDYFFDQELKPLGILQPTRIDPALLSAAFPEPTLAGVRLYDASRDAAGPAPLWVGVCLSSFGIIYNPDLYRALDLPGPRRWDDLADPKLDGFVALADPSHSGSAAVAYMMVLQRAMADAEDRLFQRRPELRAADRARRAQDAEYGAAVADGWKRGMGQLVRIAANARYFTDSSTMVPTDVAGGQAAAGMAIDFYAHVTEHGVGPARARFVSPAAATATTPDPVAVLKGVRGERRVLADRFVAFLLSPQGQRLWALRPGEPGGPVEFALSRNPIRRDVYRDRRGWSHDGDPFAAAGGFNQRADWMGLFADTRPIWVAAWIDSRDALKSAYARVLQLKDEARRTSLLAALADLPVTMREIAEQRDERRRREKDAAGDVEEWKARKQIEWAGRFRSHYRAVEAEAGRS